MTFNEETRVLISCAKDKAVRVWKLPEKWTDENIEKFEQEEIKNQMHNSAVMRIQKSNTKMMEDSDEDDLCGWDIK